MRHRGKGVTDKAALGLALATLACATRDNGFTLGEGETGGDGGGGSQDGGSQDGGSQDGGSQDGGAQDGDTGSNETGFELVSARINATGEFVALTFSKPVSPVDEVDPSDFRISFASPEILCGGGGCVDITTYRDPNYFVDQYYYEPYQYQYEYDRFDLIQITPGNQATEVFLRAVTPLDPLVCDAVTYFETYSSNRGYDLNFGLFVHHSPGAIPLTSTDGEALAAIGAQWTDPAIPVWYVEGSYPNLDPELEIPCEL